MSIQRYGALDGAQIRAQQEGLLVLYADHVAALAEAEQRAVDAEFEPRSALEARTYQSGYAAGISAERARIREGVAALCAPARVDGTPVVWTESVLALIEGGE
jgi:uncharacterized membrane protein